MGLELVTRTTFWNRGNMKNSKKIAVTMPLAVSMKNKLIARSLITSLAIAITLVSPATGSYSKDSLSITDTGFNLSTDVVPSNLHWTDKSLAIAKTAQRFLYRTLKNEIAMQKQAGAVKLKRVSHPTDSGVRNWKKLDLSPNLYSIDGYDSNGNLVLSGETLFATSQTIQNRTVYLTQETCLLRPFNLFDFETWFTQQCSITVEPKEKFLRAAMQSWLSLVGGFTPDGQAISHELQTVIAENIKFRVDKKNFYCLACSEYFKTPYASFPLEYSAGLWPYKIKYEPSNRHFSLKLLKPNYLELMSHARVVTDDLVRFDDPSGPMNSLFPIVN